MNLTELQSELRSISKKVNELEAAVEQMKPKTMEEKNNEYKVLTELAIQYPLTERGLDKAGENTRNMYISLLASMAFLEESFLKERLLYIARIAAGIGQKQYPVEQIVQLASQFDKSDIKNLKCDIEPVKENFLLDAFIVTGICGNASEIMISMLAEMATTLGYNCEDIEVFAAVSKSLLTDDFSSLDTIKCTVSHKLCGKFLHVIPTQWIVDHRIFCGRYCMTNGYDSESSVGYIWCTPKCTIKFRLDAGTIVKKGMTLVSFKEEKTVTDAMRSVVKSLSSMSVTKPGNIQNIIAPMDGLVYYIEDEIKNKTTYKSEKFVMVYVVSRFDDYGAFCNWYKTRKLTKAIEQMEKREQNGNIANR